MAELVYAYVSEAYPARVEGSSPSPPTEDVKELSICVQNS